MKKKTSIKKFIIFSVIILIGLLLTVLQFDVLFTNYKHFNGFINSINYGADFKTSTYVSFEISDRDGGSLSEVDIDETITKFKDILAGQIVAFEDVRIYEQTTSDNKTNICIKIPEKDYSTNMFQLLETSKSLEIKKSNSESAPAVLTSEHVKTASYTTVGNQYGVVIDFTNEGKRILTAFTSELNGATPYCFVEGEEMQGTIYSEYIFVYSSGMTANTASETAVNIMSGSFPVKLDFNSDVNTTDLSPELGYNSSLVFALITVVLVLGIIAFFCFRYRMMGLMATLSLIVFGVLYALIIQSIPYISFTIVSYFAVVYVLFLFVISNALAFNQMKSEYKLGKKIPTCVSQGFEKTWKTIIDIHTAHLFLSLIMLIFGSTVVKNFSLTLIIGYFISCFASIVITKMFANWYLPINSKDTKKYNFTKEGR